MTTNAVFFIGVFILIFVVWVSTGGPTKPISFSGPYLKPISGPGQLAEPYSLGRGSGTGSSAATSGGLSSLEEQIEDISSFGEPSEYRGKVSFDRSPSGPRGKNARDEYVSISVSGRLQDPVTLTGWRLESMATGVSAVIGTGVEVPRSGSVNTAFPIIVEPGSSVVVTTGRSPVGASFRESICTGYLGEFQTFTPELATSCPSAQAEFVRTYSDQDDTDCRYYAWRVPRCSVVSRVPSNLSNTCEAFLEDLSYNSCVAEHREDADYMEDTWRVFLGKNGEIWRENHETIRLMDAGGKTVDVLAY